MAAENAGSGFRELFNGKDLNGWDGDPRFWSVKEGMIVGQTTADNPTDHNTFLIWRQGEVDDFVLTFSYRLVGGNSGVQYRSRDFGNWVAGGYQADIESGDRYSGINYEERGRGILAQRGEKVTIAADGQKSVEPFADTAELQKSIKKEDWNQYKVAVHGNNLVHVINGKVMSEVVDNEQGKSTRSGILAFQLHAGPPMMMQIKDVRLKRLALQDKKKVVLVAGRPSHGSMEHEFNAGVILLKKCLDANAPNVLAASYLN